MRSFTFEKRILRASQQLIMAAFCIFVQNCFTRRYAQIVSKNKTIRVSKHNLVREIDSPRNMSKPDVMEVECPAAIDTQEHRTWKSRHIARGREEFLPTKRCKNNFLKGVKWAPDGAALLSCSDDRKLRIFNLPEGFWDVATNPGSDLESETQLPELELALSIQEHDLIYDYQWFPGMDSTRPETCAMLSAARDHPLHLWDAYSGSLVATYRAYDHADEVIAAQCASFDSDGTRIISGYRKGSVLRIFHTSRPGREYEERYLKVGKEGQGGILSCIASNKTNTNTFAVGSYSKSIGIYSHSAPIPMALVIGHRGGVTHLAWSPDGKFLFSGARRDDEILCWDTRNWTKVYAVLKRNGSSTGVRTTNQRLYFDVNSSSTMFGIGNESGQVMLWDIKSLANESEGNDISDEVKLQEPVPDNLMQQGEDSEMEWNAFHRFQAHEELINGFSFHPTHPIIATGSGQRKFPSICDTDAENHYVNNMEGAEDELEVEDYNEKLFTRPPDPVDNSIRLFSLY